MVEAGEASGAEGALEVASEGEEGIISGGSLRKQVLLLSVYGVGGGKLGLIAGCCYRHRAKIPLETRYGV